MNRAPLIIFTFIAFQFVSHAGEQTSLNSPHAGYYTNTIGMVFKRVSNTQRQMVCIHEVRQRDWVAVMEINPSFNLNTNCPVEKVSYVDAELFSKKLSEMEGQTYRLPRIKEWVEFIDQGRLTPDQASTVPVFSMPANKHGLYGIEGNVSEWCSDAEESDVRRLDGKLTKVVTRAVMGNSYFDLQGGNPTPSEPRGRYAERDLSGSWIGFRIILEK